MQLNKTESIISRDERLKVNQNWDTIESNINALTTDVHKNNEAIEATNDIATEALTTAKQIDGKATEALNKSNQAVSTSTSAKDVANSAKTTANATAQQLEMLIVESGTSDAEVIAMRVDGETGEVFETVPLRLDDQSYKIRNVQTQLASPPHLLMGGSHTKTPIVGFISDDGTTADLPIMDIFESYGVRFGLGIITDLVGTNNGYYMSWEQIKDAEKRGFEIMYHSHTHQNSTEITKEEFEEDFTTGLDTLINAGFSPRSFVYPYNAYSNDTTAITEKYIQYAFARTRSNALQQGRNYPIIDNHRIARIGFGSYFDSVNPDHPTDTTSLDYYKSRVDEAIANNSLIVFVMHTWHTDHNETQTQHLRDLIEYIQSKNVPILNPSDAMDVCGNVVQVGRTTHNKFWVTCDGKFDASDMRVKFENVNTFNFNSSPSDFALNKITYMTLNNAGASGFPEAKAGTLITNNIDSNLFGRYQDWIVGNNTYRRYATSVTAWGAFVNQSTNIYLPANDVDLTAQYTTFRAGARTVIPITTDFAQTNSFPRGVGGELIIERTTEQYYHCKRTFKTAKVLETNVQREFVYEQFVNADGTWTEWLRRGGNSTNVQLEGFTIPAKGTVDKVCNTTDVRETDVVSVTTTNDVPNGVFYTPVKTTLNTSVTVRFTNVTDNPVSLTNLTLFVNVKHRE